MNMALRSLQFEDMINQLTGHMDSRLDSIDGLVCTLSKFHKDLDTVKRDQLEGQFEDYMERLRATSREALQTSGVTRRSPVHQASMDSGDIELF